MPAQRAALWPLDVRALIAIVAGIVFLWLNAALIRTLHHNWGAPITAYGIAHSTFVQSSLSIFWGVLGFAAMTIGGAAADGATSGSSALALMVVVVAKLFLVDLSSIGTIARITSFLTVGAAAADHGLSRSAAAASRSEHAYAMTSNDLIRLPHCVSCCAAQPRARRSLRRSTTTRRASRSSHRTAQPLVEATLPDAVYQGVTRADLGDVRVFNAEGQPVPHAFCVAPARCGAHDYRAVVAGVRAARGDCQRTSDGSRVEVQTAGGTQVNVSEAGPRSPFRSATAASTSSTRATATSPCVRSSSTGRVRTAHRRCRCSIEASDDLDRWRRAGAGEHAAARDSRRSATATRTHRAAAAAVRVPARAASGWRPAARDQSRALPSASAPP